MFPVDKEVQSAILKSPTEIDLYTMLRKKGTLTMKEDALLKALRGEIPMTEVYKF
jgi:type II secretory ATPase GspE/PulE/Tfp pilus assembly ATPase PilB-like protein